MTQPIISLENVSFSYAAPPVLEHVDLSVDKGDFLSIIGPNGGGKTTLLKLILGLLKPGSGTVRVFGERPGQNPGRIGYVPQYMLIKPGFPITALGVALMGFAGRGRFGFLHSKAEKRRALEALAQAGVQEHASRRFDSLSGGQRQRVLVARALVADPELLVLDEPTSNIDPHGKSCLFQLLAELGKKATILVVSHDLSITALRIGKLACVNRNLLMNDAPEPTPEMLALLYGSHDHTCPVGDYLQDFSSLFHPRHDHTPGGPHA